MCILHGGSDPTFILKNSWRRPIIKEAGRSCNELRFLAADRSGNNSVTTYVSKKEQRSLLLLLLLLWK
jgi:hypothetical protein